MGSSYRKIALVGASGSLGRPILKALLDSGLEVLVLTRTNSDATFDQHPKLRVSKIEYTLKNLADVLQGHDALVSAVGVKGILDQLTMIDAVEAAGVQRFIVSEFAYPPEHDGLPELEFSRQIKKKVLDYLHKRSIANSRFTWTAIATGLPFDSVIKRFPQAFGFDIHGHQARLHDDGLEPFSASTLLGISHAVTEVLAHPDATANRFVRIRSLETTQKAILDEMEALTGSAWTVEQIDSGEVRKEANEKIAAGQGATADLVAVQLFARGSGRSLVATSTTSDNKLLGVKQESLRSILEQVLNIKKA